MAVNPSTSSGQDPSTKLRIKKAVLPVAGLGTRVMPLTLHQPKGMIGIVDRPMIHYVIDEIVSAGIKHIIIVHGPRQKEFKIYIRHLEKNPDWKKLKVKFDFALQKELHGNGDAVYSAKKYLGNEPFLVCFSDDLLVDKVPPMKTLMQFFEKQKAPVIVLEPVDWEFVSRYGVVKAKKARVKDLYEISDVVEKPERKQAPSNLTIIGRYIITPELFSYIEKLYPYRGKVIGIADALKNYANDGNKLYGWHFKGKRFDAGSKLGILQAQAYFGLHHKDLGPEFKKYLKSI